MTIASYMNTTSEHEISASLPLKSGILSHRSTARPCWHCLLAIGFPILTQLVLIYVKIMEARRYVQTWQSALVILHLAVYFRSGGFSS